MPSDKEKEEVNTLLEKIFSAQANLRAKAHETSILPAKLKTEVNDLCKEAAREAFRLETLSTDDPSGALKALKTVQENLDRTSFLVESVNLTLRAKENNSSFLNKLGSETSRIGTTFSEMVSDKSRSDSVFFTSIKAVVSSCLSAVAGACKGIRQGFVEDGVLGALKGGATGALLGAAGGAADVFMKSEDRARKQITDLRQENANELLVLYDKVKNESDPVLPANKARIEILKEEQKYLSELEGKLNNNPDPTTQAQIVGSLRILSLTSAGSALMHTALETIHDFSSPQKFGGLEGGKALEQLGKDVLSATKNFNTVLDDSSSSLPSKLFSVAKAFASAAFEGVKGCLSGMSEGFKQEKGFSAIGSAIKGALFGGFSGLASGFNKSLEKDLAAKQEQSEVVLTAPSSTNKGPPSISSPSSVELSTLGQSSERDASLDEVDDSGLHPT